MTVGQPVPVRPDGDTKVAQNQPGARLRNVSRTGGPVKVLLPAGDTKLALGDNPQRRRAIFWNSTPGIVYLAFGSRATTTEYSVEVASGQGYEFYCDDFSGEVYAVAVSSGTLRVTEFV